LSRTQAYRICEYTKPAQTSNSARALLRAVDRVRGKAAAQR